MHLVETMPGRIEAKDYIGHTEDVGEQRSVITRSLNQIGGSEKHVHRFLTLDFFGQEKQNAASIDTCQPTLVKRLIVATFETKRAENNLPRLGLVIRSAQKAGEIISESPWSIGIDKLE